MKKISWVEVERLNRRLTNLGETEAATVLTALAGRIDAIEKACDRRELIRDPTKHTLPTYSIRRIIGGF